LLILIPQPAIGIIMSDSKMNFNEYLSILTKLIKIFFELRITFAYDPM
jgi:hypothetical protein